MTSSLDGEARRAVGEARRADVARVIVAGLGLLRPKSTRSRAPSKLISAKGETLPGLLGAGEPELYAPVTVAAHIQAKLNGSRNLVSNAKAGRKAKRVGSATS